MSNLSVEDALNIMSDRSQSESDREQAIRSLTSSPTPAVIGKLIEALEDDDAGVRWASADALIEIGDAALRPLLQALVEKSDSLWLRESAYRVFHDTKSLKVSSATQEVVKALKGPAASLATTETAGQALARLT